MSRIRRFTATVVCLSPVIVSAAGTPGCAESPATPTPVIKNPPPAATIGITSVSPQIGIAGAREGVVIRGSGFQKGAVVTFGADAGSVTNIGAVLINVVTPALNTGPVDVIVTNPDGSSATLPGGYTSEPVVLTATPEPVAAGAPLTIRWSMVYGHSQHDWIGLFEGQAGSYANLSAWWGYTNGAESGSFTINAPAKPGVYAFGYYLYDTWDDIAHTTVTVTP